MARRKKDATGDMPVGTPARQDEADIVAEVGAVQSDDDSGELLADEAKIREAGAVDAESIRENRRIEEMINKKRSGLKDVPFNVDNLLEKYEGIIKYWPASTIDILVNRITGTPVQWVIKSRPRSGSELYEAIKMHHGRYEEATYNVLLFDTNDKKRRGTGRITIPDTRDTPPSLQTQGQPPMTPYYPPPYGQPPQSAPQGSSLPPTTVQVVPPAIDPIAMMQQMFAMFQQLQHPPQPASSAPQSPPQPQAPVVAQPSTDPMAMMSRAFEMFQKMQQSTQSAQSSPQPQQASPPPTDPMAVMQESFRLFQQMQPQQAPQAAAPPSPPQGSDPATVMAWALQKMQQSSQPQPDPMAMMTRMFEMFQKMQQSLQPQQASGGSGPGPGYSRPGPYSRPPYEYGHRPPYSPPSGEPPQRPKTAAEEFKEAAGILDMAVSLADRFRPQPVAEPDYRNTNNDDDNPVKVVDVSGWPVVVNKHDGSARKWETVVANAGNVLKWVAEQREAMQKAALERETKQRRQQLPEGYVEMTPGYQPPQGFVAVPIDRAELPQPPAEMPPPITQSEAPRPRTWGMPPMPESGG
jgi:hypothetical protein